MKAGCLALLVVVVLGGAGASFLTYRHFHPPHLPYLVQPVERMDIESTVTTLGHIADNRDTVEASVPEADIFKLHPGQRVIFNLVAVPDSRFEGTVEEVKAMPIAAFAAAAADAKKADDAKKQAGAGGQGADNSDADNAGADQTNEPADLAKAMAEPNKKRDIFSSNGEGVFYRVLFNMGDTAGRYPAGMSVMTHVVLGVATQVPTISIAALGKAAGEDRYEVQVLDAKGHMATRQITTGLANTLSIEVKSGLQPGDRTVIRDDGNLYSPGYKG